MTAVLTACAEGPRSAVSMVPDVEVEARSCTPGEMTLDERWSVAGPLEEAVSTALSPAGAAIASQDGTIELWGTSPAGAELGGAILLDAAPYGGVTCQLAFGDAGRTLAVAHWTGTVALVDVASGSEVASTDGMNVLGVAVSDDGTLVAFADASGAVRIWTPKTGEVVQAPSELTTGNLAFVPGTHDLVLAGQAFSGWAATPVVERWSANDGWTRSVGWNLDARRMAILPDGSGVVVAAWGSVARIDLDRPEASPIVAATTWHQPDAIAASPDGASFATVGTEGTIRVWDTATLTERTRRDLALQVGVGWDASGERVVTVGRDGVLRSFGCEG